VNILAAGVNADQIAEFIRPQVATDEEARRVVIVDSQHVGRRVKPQLVRVRHICITNDHHARTHQQHGQYQFREFTIPKNATSLFQ